MSGCKHGHDDNRFCTDCECDTLRDERDAAVAEVERLRGRLGRIAMEKCAYDGNYDSCYEAIDDTDYTGPCAPCIARAALAPPTPGVPVGATCAECGAELICNRTHAPRTPLGGATPDCATCLGRGGRRDDVAIDQWYDCDDCGGTGHAPTPEEKP